MQQCDVPGCVDEVVVGCNIVDERDGRCLAELRFCNRHGLAASGWVRSDVTIEDCVALDVLMCRKGD